MPTDSQHYTVTYADAIDLHEQILAASSGRSGILNESSLLSALARPYCGYFETLPEKAAALMEAVVQNHGFVDGNKRTALMLSLKLIAHCGARLEPISGEDLGLIMENMVVDLAAGRIGHAAILAFFEARLALHSPPTPL